MNSREEGQGSGYNLFGKYLWWALGWALNVQGQEELHNGLYYTEANRAMRQTQGLWKQRGGKKGNWFYLRVTKAPWRQRWVLDANIVRRNGNMHLRLCGVDFLPRF